MEQFKFGDIVKHGGKKVLFLGHRYRHPSNLVLIRFLNARDIRYVGWNLDGQMRCDMNTSLRNKIKALGYTTGLFWVESNYIEKGDAMCKANCTCTVKCPSCTCKETENAD